MNERMCLCILLSPLVQTVIDEVCYDISFKWGQGEGDMLKGHYIWLR